jgi:cystathionine beta-lyase/cystathionine gamma-synthase
MASKRTAARGRKTGFATKAIHAGQSPDPTTGAVMQPIYQVATYRQPGLGAGWKYDYARTINPTRGALEDCLAALEGGLEARCFASGMSAIAAVMNLLRSGDHVIASRNVYGGTYRLFEGLLRQFGLTFSWVDTSDLAAVERAMRPATKMLYVETPTNPVLGLTDLAAASAIARKRKLRLVVDNTFMSPYFQRPIASGTDIVVHSTTKYLGGHSDTVGGFAATNDPTIAERLYFLQKSLGAVPGPFDCWLVLRGLKTLALRMRQHCENARAITEFLVGHPKVERVLYPGLPNHPGHDVAARQMSDFGGMVSFLAPSAEEAVALVARTKIFKLAESLGGVESLIEVPFDMTHASTADAPFASPPNLVRLSVGVESADDLVADLESALVRSAATA